MPRCTEGLALLEPLGAHGTGGVQPAAWHDYILEWVAFGTNADLQAFVHTDGIFCNVH